MQAGGEQSPPESEHQTEQQRADGEPQPSEAEHVPIPPSLVDVARVAFDDLAIVCRSDVVKDVADLHAPEPLEQRAMRIAFLVGERMMLSVDGDPLLRMEAGGQPEH